MRRVNTSLTAERQLINAFALQVLIISVVIADGRY